MVGDIKNGLGWVAIDEFHAEDFGLREGCFDIDIEGRRLQFRFVSDFAANLLDVFNL